MPFVKLIHDQKEGDRVWGKDSVIEVEDETRAKQLKEEYGHKESDGPATDIPSVAKPAKDLRGYKEGETIFGGPIDRGGSPASGAEPFDKEEQAIAKTAPAGTVQPITEPTAGAAATAAAAKVAAAAVKAP
jgi:hypothetical protein